MCRRYRRAIRHPYEAATSALHGDVDIVRLRALLRAEPPTEEQIAAQSEVAWVDTPEQLRQAVAFLMGCTVRGYSVTVVQERVALEQGAAVRAPHPVATLAMQQKLISTHMHASGLQLGPERRAELLQQARDTAWTSRLWQLIWKRTTSGHQRRSCALSSCRGAAARLLWTRSRCARTSTASGLSSRARGY
jgi:hypothetical protein